MSEVLYKQTTFQAIGGSLQNIILDDYVKDYVDLMLIEQILRYPIARRFFKLYLLHDDETIKEDITSYVTVDSTLEKTYQQGQTRSMSINLINPQKIWNPSPTSGKLFANSKFKLQMGIILNENVYWVDEGVFVCQDPDLKNSDANKIVSIELFDKYALLDGTITGTTETDYELSVGSNIYQSVRGLLRLPFDNLGNPYDRKKIRFPLKYMQNTTPYTIKKAPNNNIGEIITDIADSMSCDVFYDEIGNLTFRDNLDDLDYHYRTEVWNYREDKLEFNNVSRKDQWSKIKNRFVVIGSNINGFVCKGLFENTNPKSAYNINGSFGIKPSILEDNLINSPIYCEQRAKYEARKNYMRNISVTFNSIYIPHLKPNDLVRWSYSDYDYVNELFIVDSVSIPLNPTEMMSVTITNVNELPL